MEPQRHETRFDAPLPDVQNRRACRCKRRRFLCIYTSVIISRLCAEINRFGPQFLDQFTTQSGRNKCRIRAPLRCDRLIFHTAMLPIWAAYANNIYWQHVEPTITLRRPHAILALLGLGAQLKPTRVRLGALQSAQCDSA